MTTIEQQILAKLEEVSRRLGALERDRLLSSEEVAEYLGVTVRTVSNYVSRGVLPEPMRAGRLRRWPLSVIREAPERIRRLDARRRRGA